MRCPYAQNWPDLKYRSKMKLKCLYYHSSNEQPYERDLKGPCELDKIEGKWLCVQNSKLEVKVGDSRIL
jgi:hypothetical protein